MSGSRAEDSGSALSPGDGTLLAVLLNPPSASTGARSLGAVRRATGALGFVCFEVANLFAEPTPTVVELNAVSPVSASWPTVRDALSDQLRTAGGVLAAWGVSGVSGNVKRERDYRAVWTLAEAERLGHHRVWTLAGEARHPSRWHQYVADKYGRCSGGTFEERLGQVLRSRPTRELLASIGQSRPGPRQ